MRLYIAVAGALLALTAACTDEPDTVYLQDVTDVSDDITAPDPYSHSGTWFVPEQIQPGRYAVLPGDEQGSQWVQLCADRYCEHPKSGPNDVAYAETYGPTFIVVPDDGSVQGLRNNGVRLQWVDE